MKTEQQRAAKRALLDRVTRWRSGGRTLEAIAKRLRCTRQYVRILIAEAKAEQEAKAAGWGGLSVRARNVVRATQVTSRAGLLDAYLAGKLLLYRNCGEGTVEEIGRWLGVPNPAEHKFIAACPHCAGALLVDRNGVVYRREVKP